MLRDVVPIQKRAAAFAKDLRKQQTNGEKLLWQNVRNRKYHGLKFRRQVPIGPYIVDFLCVEKNVIVEIDGCTHWEEEAKKHDRERDMFL